MGRKELIQTNKWSFIHVHTRNISHAISEGSDKTVR